jgi:DNA anti-recombination protein RmuC
MITDTASNLMDKYSLVKASLIKTMTSFNAHGKNLQNVIKGTWQGQGSLEQRIEKLQEQGINPKNPIPKTSELEDKLLKFEENEAKENKDLN